MHRKYLVVVERAAVEGWMASLPDLARPGEPGIVVTGSTPEEVLRLAPAAIEFYFRGLRASGEPIPEPNARRAYVEVKVKG